MAMKKSAKAFGVLLLAVFVGVSLAMLVNAVTNWTDRVRVMALPESTE